MEVSRDDWEAIQYDRDKLAEQNAKMLAFLKSDCADCKAASQATKAQCALCENGKIIAEIEE